MEEVEAACGTEVLDVYDYDEGEGEPALATSWTKHLDPTTGRFYYLDSSTGQTTWDRPAFVELSLSAQSLPLRPLVCNSVDTIDRAQRSQYIRQVFAEKKEIRLLKDEEGRMREFHQRLSVWTQALERAAGSSDDVQVTWTQFGYIDPCVYDYQERFGRPMSILRLIGIGLEKLPDEVGFKLRSLRILNVSSNLLESLPDSVLHLTNLQELHLAHNKLRRLPERIGLMGSLRRLEIANNLLERLPVTLAGLTKIERLDAESNCLRILPENLDAMKSCGILNFNHNELTRLPRCLGRMPRLVALSASSNGISYIPEELCQSRTLTRLRLNLNLVSHIPEKIGQLTQLVELSLDSNRLAGFPMSFYQLGALRVLRVESNPHLMSPSAAVIAEGAEGVVAWCAARYKDNELARMKYIVQTSLLLLEQVARRGVADPAYFEAGVSIRGDDWFALQWDYLWETLIPRLESVWYKELMLGRGHNEQELFSFPFSRTDVQWAFAHYGDAYGQLMLRQKADFRKCACVDAAGRRKPCVPPRTGFMCSRMCTLLKSVVVTQAQKQWRSWTAYQKHSLEDAVKRAEHEALKYLNSAAGQLWLTLASYQKAEEMMNDKLAVVTVANRERVVNKKKLAVVRSFERRIARVEAVRDQKASALKGEIGANEEELRTARPGYQSKRLVEKIESLVEQLNSLPENATIEELHASCGRECEALEDAMLEDYDDGDGKEGGAAVAGKKAGPKTYEAPRDDEDIAAMVREEFDKAWVASAELAVEGRRVLKVAQRSMRVALDIAEIRVRKLYMVAHGDFAEIQRELRHEMFSQYVDHSVATVRRKTEDGFRNIDLVRSAMQGRDIRQVFDDWRSWVKSKLRRVRRDLRMECRRAVRGFDAAMESINIVTAHLADWEQLEDIFTERPFWRNSKTGQVSMERPGFEHYLPNTFRVPTPPKPLPPDVSVETSSDEDDDESRRKLRPKRKKHAGGAHEGAQIRIDGQVDVSDSSSEASEDEPLGVTKNNVRFAGAATEAGGSFVSAPFTKKNLEKGASRTKDDAMNASSNSMPTVTTARTGNMGGSFTFASPFKRYHGESFYSINEAGAAVTSSGSFYALHLPRQSSSASVGEFVYGPDEVRAQRSHHQVTKMRLVGGELHSKIGAASVLAADPDPRVVEMYRRLEAATAFKATKEYLHHSTLLGGPLEVGDVPDDLKLSEVKAVTLAGNVSEMGVAERTLLKAQEQFSEARHRTYLNQMTRQARSFEDIKRDKEAKGGEGGGHGNDQPVPEELLHFAGGDNRMTWVKGETGMRLRTVLAHRALHVEKVLHAEAVKKGIAAPKSTTFYQRELAPMFKDGLSSGSEDDDDGDDEARKARVARRIEEQKQLMRLKRSEEDKKAIDTLRLRRLKEKYTR